MEGIQIKNLSKVYNKDEKNENIVLRNLSFTINKGELVAVVGKSGSGKSTLLHILGCLDEATEGEYYLDGIDVGKLNNKEKAHMRNEKIGFILQDFGLILDDTVLESVMLPMMFDNTKLSEIQDKAVDKIKKVGMEKLMNSRVSTLSGGEKQRTAIARALVKNPDYILADEPTGALDSENAKLFMQQLRELHENGKTIIMVTHDLELAKQCDRIIKIADGCLYDKCMYDE